MFKRTIYSLILLLSCIISSNVAYADPPKAGLHHNVSQADSSDLLNILSARLSELIDYARPSVVSIHGFIQLPEKHSIPAWKNRIPITGTGFFLKGGLVITTAEVVEGMQRPYVRRAKGRSVPADSISIDKQDNIAVLHIPESDTVNGLTIGDSNSIHSGSIVIALGNQGGFANVASLGMVGSTDRSAGSLDGKRHYNDLIQFQGAVGPGSSGSPLLNSKGQVVGIVVGVYGGNDHDNQISASHNSKHPSEGYNSSLFYCGASLGFAVPSNSFKSKIEELSQGGKQFPIQGWVGLFPLRTENKALLVKVVFIGGPADIAGIRPGDTLISAGGETLHDWRQLLWLSEQLVAGQSLRVEAMRDKKTMTFLLHITPRPDWNKLHSMPRRSLPEQSP